MRFAHLVCAFSLAACVSQPAASDAGADGSTTGEGGSQLCNGLRDVTGACVDVACLGGETCTTSDVAACGVGAGGTAACVGGRCIYRQTAVGCVSGDQCACGFCGADGYCYDDQSSTCGTCAPGGSGGVDAGLPLACRSCLDSCKGSGPSCCAGCGCLCEAECQKVCF